MQMSTHSSHIAADVTINRVKRQRGAFSKPSAHFLHEYNDLNEKERRRTREWDKADQLEKEKADRDSLRERLAQEDAERTQKKRAKRLKKRHNSSQGRPDNESTELNEKVTLDQDTKSAVGFSEPTPPVPIPFTSIQAAPMPQRIRVTLFEDF